MPLPPSRRAVLTPPVSSTFKYRVSPGSSFDQDVKYVRAHLDMGRPVDGPFVAWVLDVLEAHRVEAWEDVNELRDQLTKADNDLDDADRRGRIFSEAVANFLAGKIKKAALEKAHDDYTNGD